MYTFCKLSFDIQRPAFEVTLHRHQPDGIHPMQIHLIWIRDSPDHRSVHNKEVKFM